MRRLLLEHLPAALLIGLVGAWLSGNWVLVPIALATGWMIDADHLFDWSLYARRVGVSSALRELSTGAYFRANGRVFVVLHSWEWVAIWLVAGVAAGRPDIAIVGSLSWAAHIAKDQWTYRVVPPGYFLIYRMVRGFAHEGFCREKRDAVLAH